MEWGSTFLPRRKRVQIGWRRLMWYLSWGGGGVGVRTLLHWVKGFFVKHNIEFVHPNVQVIRGSLSLSAAAALLIMPKTKKVRKGHATSKKTIPYVRGFHPPSGGKCLEAIGESSKVYSPSDDFFPPLPKPTSIDDWLAQYKETGQTYKQFLNECPWLSPRKWKYVKMTFNSSGRTLLEKYPEGKIYLLPLGGFDGETAPSFSDLAQYARLFFCLPVEILPPLQLSFDQSAVYCAESVQFTQVKEKQVASRKSNRPYKLEARFHSKTGNVQLQVQSILWKLRQCIPPDALCLMALTMADLYDTDTDLFVAGMASWQPEGGSVQLLPIRPNCDIL